MNSTRTRAALAGCLLAVAALAAAGLLTGSFPLSFSEILQHPGGLSARVFWQLRLPRTLMGLAGGWALGMAGGVYQTVFANPLASPDLTGVSSGASLGAAAAIVLGAGGRLSVTLFSFAFGMAALAAVLGLVGAARLARTGSYLLAGVIVSSLAEAGLMALKTLADPEGQLGAIESWTMGSLSAVTAGKTALPALLAAGCAVLLWLVRKPILMLSLGESAARSLGLDPALWRALVLSLTTLMVAAVVSVCGAVAFVGLIAPHIAFFLGGRRGGPYLALCGLCGAAVLLAADLPARLLNLPLSIFTVAAAVPVLLLDEPGSALDFSNTHRLFRLLGRQLAAGGRCAVAVLHDPALALRYCSPVLLLKEGRILERLEPGACTAPQLERALGRLYPGIRVKADKQTGHFLCTAE